MGLEIRVLGGFSVLVDGERVSSDAWRNRRAADVVKLLAMEPSHQLHRDQVMEMLWPDLNAEAAAANLRKSLHHARRVLGSQERLQMQGGLVVLCPDDALDVDLERFERDADAALASAEGASCARVAANFADVLPADRYEYWAEETRSRARSKYRALLAAAGDWQKILETDPTDEVAHRAIMRSHLDDGNRRDAIRQFERLRDALRDHLGIGPDHATVELYDEALAIAATDPPTPSERVSALLAHGLVAWGRQELAEAERLALDARRIALDADLGHELGEASSLLALVAFARGTWHDTFREDFERSMTTGERFEAAVYDGHLCFLEYFLCGPEGQAGADSFASELMDIAQAHESTPGRALATLLLGEFCLLSGDLESAVPVLTEAAAIADEAALDSASSIAMERLGEALVALGDRAAARRLVQRAMPLASRSTIPSHLVVRLLAINVRAAATKAQALLAVRAGERWMTDAPHVCGPCSMTFRIEAVRAYARAGDLAHARRHVAEADRIAGMWQGGPWRAAVWEAQAELRRAEGHAEQAAALYAEAAEQFDEFHRRLDARRCRELALAVPAHT
jgi:DNA-binding SARP family transcriptional activator